MRYVLCCVACLSVNVSDSCDFYQVVGVVLKKVPLLCVTAMCIGYSLICLCSAYVICAVVQGVLLKVCSTCTIQLHGSGSLWGNPLPSTAA